jgi:hypothetical protein
MNQIHTPSPIGILNTTIFDFLDYTFKYGDFPHYHSSKTLKNIYQLTKSTNFELT